ncbi:hypothetical protein pipiens_002719 [Culex pipiens pipiens]|uniref:Uncharacterized protein n=1 Tax=Culex pipiens pipiens TaxID=38569 RepID=A0ABD1DAB3_CULPP
MCEQKRSSDDLLVNKIRPLVNKIRSLVNKIRLLVNKIRLLVNKIRLLIRALIRAVLLTGRVDLSSDDLLVNKIRPLVNKIRLLVNKIRPLVNKIRLLVNKIRLLIRAVLLTGRVDLSSDDLLVNKIRLLVNKINKIRLLVNKIRLLVNKIRLLIRAVLLTGRVDLNVTRKEKEETSKSFHVKLRRHGLGQLAAKKRKVRFVAAAGGRLHHGPERFLGRWSGYRNRRQPITLVDWSAGTAPQKAELLHAGRRTQAANKFKKTPPDHHWGRCFGMLECCELPRKCHPVDRSSTFGTTRVWEVHEERILILSSVAINALGISNEPKLSPVDDLPQNGLARRKESTGMELAIIAPSVLSGDEELICRSSVPVRSTPEGVFCGGRSSPDWSGEEEEINRHGAGHHRAIGSVWRRGVNMPIFSSGALDAGRSFLRWTIFPGLVWRGGRNQPAWSWPSSRHRFCLETRNEYADLQFRCARRQKEFSPIHFRCARRRKEFSAVDDLPRTGLARRKESTGMELAIIAPSVLSGDEELICRSSVPVRSTPEGVFCGGRSSPDWSGEEEEINRHGAGHHRAIGSVWRRGVNMPIFSSGALDAGRSFLRWTIFPGLIHFRCARRRKEFSAVDDLPRTGLARRKKSTGMELAIIAPSVLSGDEELICRSSVPVRSTPEGVFSDSLPVRSTPEGVFCGGRSSPDWSGEEEEINRHGAGHHRAIGSVWRRGMNMLIFSSGALDARRSFLRFTSGALDAGRSFLRWTIFPGLVWRGGRNQPAWSWPSSRHRFCLETRNEYAHLQFRCARRQKEFSPVSFDHFLRKKMCWHSLPVRSTPEGVFCGGRSSPDWSGEEEEINRHGAGHHRAIGSVWRRGMNMLIFSSGALDARRSFLRFTSGALDAGRSFLRWTIFPGLVWRGGRNQPAWSWPSSRHRFCLETRNEYAHLQFRCARRQKEFSPIHFRCARRRKEFSAVDDLPRTGLARRKESTGMELAIIAPSVLSGDEELICRSSVPVRSTPEGVFCGGRSSPDWSGEEEEINRHGAGHHRAIGSVWRRGVNMPIFSSGALDAGRSFLRWTIFPGLIHFRCARRRKEFSAVDDLPRTGLARRKKSTGMELAIIAPSVLSGDEELICRSSVPVRSTPEGVFCGGRSSPDWSGEEEEINRHGAGHHRAIGSVWRRGVNMPIFSSGALDAGRSFLRWTIFPGLVWRGGRNQPAWSWPSSRHRFCLETRNEYAHLQFRCARRQKEFSPIHFRCARRRKEFSAVDDLPRTGLARRKKSTGMELAIIAPSVLSGDEELICRSSVPVRSTPEGVFSDSLPVRSTPEGVFCGGRSSPDWSGEEEGIDRHGAGHHRAIGSVWRRGVNMPIFSSGALDAGRSFLRWTIFPGLVWRGGRNQPAWSWPSSRHRFCLETRNSLPVRSTPEGVFCGGRSSPDWSGEEEGIDRHGAGHHRAIGSKEFSAVDDLPWTGLARRKKSTGMELAIIAPSVLSGDEELICRSSVPVRSTPEGVFCGGRSSPDWSGEEEEINRHGAGHHRAIGSVWRRGVNMPIFSSGALDARRSFLRFTSGALDAGGSFLRWTIFPDWSGEEEEINRHGAGHHRAIGSVWRRGMNMLIFSSGALDARRSFLRFTSGALDAGRSFLRWTIFPGLIHFRCARRRKEFSAVDDLPRTGLARRKKSTGMELAIIAPSVLSGDEELICRSSVPVRSTPEGVFSDSLPVRSTPEGVFCGGRSSRTGLARRKKSTGMELAIIRAIGSVWRRGVNMPIFSSGALDAGRSFLRWTIFPGLVWRGGRNQPAWSWPSSRHRFCLETRNEYAHLQFRCARRQKEFSPIHFRCARRRKEFSAVDDLPRTGLARRKKSTGMELAIIAPSVLSGDEELICRSSVPVRSTPEGVFSDSLPVRSTPEGVSRGGRSSPDWSGEEEGIDRHGAGHHRAIGSVWRRGVNMPIFSSGALDAGRIPVRSTPEGVFCGGRSSPDWSGEEEEINRHGAGHHRAIGSVWRRGVNMPIFSSGALDAGRSFLPVDDLQRTGLARRKESTGMELAIIAPSVLSGDEELICRSSVPMRSTPEGIHFRCARRRKEFSAVDDLPRTGLARRKESTGMELAIIAPSVLSGDEELICRSSVPVRSTPEGVFCGGRSSRTGLARRKKSTGMELAIIAPSVLSGDEELICRSSVPVRSTPEGVFSDSLPVRSTPEGVFCGGRSSRTGLARRKKSTGMELAIIAPSVLSGDEELICRSSVPVRSTPEGVFCGGRSSPDWSGEEEEINRHGAGHHRAIGSVWRRGVNMPIFSSGALDAGRSFLRWTIFPTGLARRKKSTGMELAIIAPSVLSGDEELICRSSVPVRSTPEGIHFRCARRRKEFSGGGRSSPDWSGEEEGIDRHGAGHHRAIGSVWRRGVNMPIFSSGALDAGRSFLRWTIFPGLVWRGGRNQRRHGAGHHRAIGSVWRRGVNMPIFSSGALDAGRSFLRWTIFPGLVCEEEEINRLRAAIIAPSVLSGDEELICRSSVPVRSTPEGVFCGGRSSPDWSGEEEEINRHGAGHHRAIGSVRRRGVNMPIFSSGALDARRSFLRFTSGALDAGRSFLRWTIFPDWSGEEEGIDRHGAGHHRAIGSVWRRGVNMPIFSSGALDAGRSFLRWTIFPGLVWRGGRTTGMELAIIAPSVLSGDEELICRSSVPVRSTPEGVFCGGRSSPDWSGKEGINRYGAGHHRAIGSVWRRGINVRTQND